MANELAQESSPYLLQHAENPVHWLPWGEVALRRARDEDRPLLVSIGYSSCHWCHVMERESFEDEQTAALMNEHFVCVKVDREERPDIDAIYMDAVQAMTGHGGWPLNVFLTPDQVPFYGGTYFPPQARHGLPAWRDVVWSLAQAWDERREEIAESAERIRERVSTSGAPGPGTDPSGDHLLDDAVRILASSYDERDGGFGRAPKFPPSCVLGFLISQAASGSEWAGRAEAMARHTLEQMAIGAIHDQAGGGFARYAVDATWTVPHFEKMLYDNALLLRAYTDGYLLSGEELMRETAEGIAEWTLREMRGPEGTFYSALDADSDGEEGLFYTWTQSELDQALGDDRELAKRWLTTAPFDGRLVIEARGDATALTTDERATIRARLRRAREPRVRPQTDTKRLASWNGLMIGALARAGAALHRPAWVQAAAEAATYVLVSMRDPDGRLLRTSDGTSAKLNGYLEDHAFLVEGLLDLYEATFEPRWFHEARGLADAAIARFADDEHGGFFSTSSDHEQLIVRRKDLEDNPIPSGASSIAVGLMRLAALSGEAEYEQRAASVLRLTHDIAPRHPHAFGHLLMALDFYVRPTREVALAGDDVSELAAVVRSAPRPHLVLAGPPGDGVALMDGRAPVDGGPAAYVCENFACRRPVTDPGELDLLLADDSPGAGGSPTRVPNDE